MAEENVNFTDIFAPELGVSGQEDIDGGNPSSQEEEGSSKEKEIDVNSILKEISQDPEDGPQGDQSGKSQEGEDDSVGVTERGESPDSDSSSTTKPIDDKEESPTLLFARFLSERGNLASYDEDEFKQLISEKGEDEALSHLWNNEADVIRNELLDTYEQDVKEYLELLDSGVSPTTAKDIASNEKKLSEITTESLEDEDNLELRKDLIKQRYKLTTSFTDSKINKLVEQSVSLGEDVEEATEAVEALKTYYKEAKTVEKQNIVDRQKAQARQSEAQLQKFKEDVNAIKEIIPGMPLTDKQKSNIIDKLTKPVKEVNGVAMNSVWAKRQEDPFKFDTIIAALDDIGVFEGKWDKLVKKVKTDTVSKFRASLDRTSNRSRTGATDYSYDGEDKVQRKIQEMKGII